MFSILKELAETQELACIYREDNPSDAFNVGRVVAVDEDFTLIYSITPKGEYDGYYLQETDSIVRVDTNNRYLERIKKFMPKAMPAAIEVPDEYDDLVRVLLDHAVRNGSYVSFELGVSGHYDVDGIVLEVQEEICRILLTDESGYPDGISNIVIDEITRGECDSDEGQMRRRLYDEVIKEAT